MPHRDTEPADPNQARNKPIRDLASRSVVCKTQAQASLDNGKSQDSAAPPDVQSRPNRSPLLSSVDGVVKSAQDGLEDEGGDDSKADDGVVFVELDAAD